MPLRVLMVHPGPDFSVHDVFTGWLEAFQELGIEVATHNTNDRLIFYSKALMPTPGPDGEDAKDEEGRLIIHQAMTQDEAFMAAMQGLTDVLYTFGPQVVMFISAFFMTERMFRIIRAHGHKIVILHTESPYQDDEQLLRGQLADLNMLNDPANLDMFRREGVPAVYMPHAYRPAVHYPRTGPADPDLNADLTFIGTAFKSRIEFFEAMNLEGLDVLIAGNDWGKLPETSPLVPFIGTGLTDADCVDNADAAEAYRHAKMGLNFYRRESEDAHAADIPIAMGPREVELAACNLPFLRDPRAEGDEVLSMLPTFTSPGDASEKLRWWLAHPAERERAASLAREAIADRTFTRNVKTLLSLLEPG